jgi:hypothetical protein
MALGVSPAGIKDNLGIDFQNVAGGTLNAA